ncbi:glycosyl hydrolase family 18 protein [Streptomyces sp. NPDC054794]
MRFRRISTAVAAACAVTALATGIAVSCPTPSRPADVSAIQLQAWLYPGSPGDSQCTAPAEYSDDRVKSGALKPEYWAVSSDGTLRLETTADGLCNGYSPANVRDLKKHSAFQYPTASAMTTGDVRALVSSSTKRSKAVSQLTTLVVNAGLSGVDVDFEDYWSWSTADFANYKTFLRQLASSLHAHGKRLQVDAPAMTEDAPWYDYAQVSAAGVDELAIMAYDDQYDTPAGTRCLPITPFNWLKKVAGYAKSKVPDPSRLVIGLPSYGYSAPAPCDPNAVTGNIQFSVMQQSPGFSRDPATVERRRDPSSGEIRWTSGGVLYDYVDGTAMDRKLAVLADLGVTKVSVWSLGGGNPWFRR